MATTKVCAHCQPEIAAKEYKGQNEGRQSFHTQQMYGKERDRFKYSEKRRFLSYSYNFDGSDLIVEWLGQCNVTSMLRKAIANIMLLLNYQIVTEMLRYY